MLKHRLTMGAVLIAAGVLGLWLDEWLDGVEAPEWIQPILGGRTTPPPGVVVFAIMFVICILASRELARILKLNGITAAKRVTTGAALTGLLICCFVPAGFDGLTTVATVGSAAIIVLLGALLYYSRNQTVEGVVAALGGALLAFVYLGLMFGFVLAVRREHSSWVLLWILAVTKSCDIGAYFTGVSIGRHKLIPWLSPGKTWEGLGGGVVFAAVVGVVGMWLLRMLTGEATPALWTGAVAGVLLGLAGQAGDLIASLFKRDAGLKDSSKVLPGFGGMLDVIDSPILAAPVGWWWLLAVW